MPKMSRTKGKTYERSVEVWLEEAGMQTDRTMVGAAVEDICLHRERISIECKNQKAMTLAAWLDQAVEQAETRPADWTPVVVHKRKGCTDVGEHYATLRLSDLVALIKRLEA